MPIKSYMSKRGIVDHILRYERTDTSCFLVLSWCALGIDHVLLYHCCFGEINLLDLTFKLLCSFQCHKLIKRSLYSSKRGQVQSLKIVWTIFVIQVLNKRNCPDEEHFTAHSYNVSQPKTNKIKPVIHSQNKDFTMYLNAMLYKLSSVI